MAPRKVFRGIAVFQPDTMNFVVPNENLNRLSASVSTRLSVLPLEIRSRIYELTLPEFRFVKIDLHQFYSLRGYAEQDISIYHEKNDFTGSEIGFPTIDSGIYTESSFHTRKKALVKPNLLVAEDSPVREEEAMLALAGVRHLPVRVNGTESQRTADIVLAKRFVEIMLRMNLLKTIAVHVIIKQEELLMLEDLLETLQHWAIRDQNANRHWMLRAPPDHNANRRWMLRTPLDESSGTDPLLSRNGPLEILGVTTLHTTSSTLNMSSCS